MKFLFALLLAIVVFGTGGYFTWKLYVQPRQALREERQQGPPPAPPDPTIPEYDKCVEIQQSGKLIEARTAFADFVERYPDSTKIEDAKERLGQINSYIFLSSAPAPEKVTYTVQKGEVISRVALKMHTTPELIMKANDLDKTMLLIGQRLTVAPSEFTVRIDRRNRTVALLNYGKFFKQYSILSGGEPKPGRAPAQAGKKAAPTPRPPKVIGKVTEVIAFINGQRVGPFDKGKTEEYADADHWIVISPAGHSLYTDRGDEAPIRNKPSGGGYGLASDAMQELATMLNKNTPVTIE